MYSKISLAYIMQKAMQNSTELQLVIITKSFIYSISDDRYQQLLC